MDFQRKILAAKIEADFVRCAALLRSGQKRAVVKVAPFFAVLAAKRAEEYQVSLRDLEISNLRAEVDLLNRTLSTCTSLVSQVDDLINALDTYGVHDRRCDITMLNVRYDSMIIPDDVRDQTQCTCGFAQALEIAHES